ncbi:MAG: hypothetical protein IJM64_04940 [Ottowia sp.]|nr:hypothetical protein [Ottowia sp.]
MKKREIYEEFRDVVARLVGEKCWAVIAGKGTGSHVSMKIGAKIPGERPLKNPTLTEDERNFEGEFGLFVTEASWRVEDAEAVLCTDTDENTGKRYAHLRGLAGRKITSASVAFPSFDLHLEFEGGIHFRVFSTFANDTEEYSDYDNYIFFTQDATYSVDGRSAVSKEKQ